MQLSWRRKLYSVQNSSENRPWRLLEGLQILAVSTWLWCHHLFSWSAKHQQLCVWPPDEYYSSVQCLHFDSDLYPLLREVSAPLSSCSLTGCAGLLVCPGLLEHSQWQQLPATSHKDDMSTVRLKQNINSSKCKCVGAIPSHCHLIHYCYKNIDYCSFIL